MSEITEQFVPYKQAEQLKELGFDEDCLGYYEDSKLQISQVEYMEYYMRLEAIFKIESEDNFYVLAPLYSQTFDWFREKHNLNPWIDCNSDKKWLWTINFIEVGEYIQSDDWLEELENLPDSYETFQEAQLACLDKLISLVKEKK